MLTTFLFALVFVCGWMAHDAWVSYVVKKAMAKMKAAHDVCATAHACAADHDCRACMLKQLDSTIEKIQNMKGRI